ncbi:palmitoyl-acyl carrier protein thioesterase, chloroplastic-like [Actinidia eriantha]|uniref:palmitoyl-acyl carrier protein thioesterase, chloroplastic-like n=1 Tax=Actinidia eriantha TaxID=165200 RepID=UPI002585E2B9|nr:palmitoyl-acyl carrier protein thioesterase, chloroplastic-like [Actinidia eriantha]
MTSMASTKSFSIYYADDLCRAERRNVGIFKLGFSTLRIPRIVREKLVVKANSGGSSKIADMINGKKVNGVVPSLGERGGEVLKQGGVHEPVHTWLLGRFVEDRCVYRQTFVIRSYEIGPDKTATMETLMNLLQETALNHVTSSGLAGNGFGATREMSLRKLIWVVTRIHVQVDKYSSWGDVIEIDTWVDAAGKNGMRRDWIIRDCNSQRIITRATSTWVIMNRETRRLSKIPDEVRKEVQPFYLDRVAIPTADLDCEKINKLSDETAHRIRSGLAPRWSDMDANQHVNNVKYIGWILESVPIDVLEDYNLTSMTLEYRRECHQSNVLESLTTVAPKMSEDSNNFTDKTGQELESTHLLRMQADKAEIVRARSVWQSKHKHMI